MKRMLHTPIFILKIHFSYFRGDFWLISPVCECIVSICNILRLTADTQTPLYSFLYLDGRTLMKDVVFTLPASRI